MRILSPHALRSLLSQVSNGILLPKPRLPRYQLNAVIATAELPDCLHELMVGPHPVKLVDERLHAVRRGTFVHAPNLVVGIQLMCTNSAPR